MYLNSLPACRYGFVSHTALSLRPPRGMLGDEEQVPDQDQETVKELPSCPVMNHALTQQVQNLPLQAHQGRLSSLDPRKIASLASLVLQTTCLILTIRYSRTVSAGQVQYLSSTAVVMSEVIKTLACLVIVATTTAKPLELLRTEVNLPETLRLAVPSGLYTAQNNLQFLAVSNLDAATFQVTYQLKLLTTALFSVVLLKKQLSRQKWSALFLLTIGVALVQIPAPSTCSRWEEDGTCKILNKTGVKESLEDRAAILGLLAVVAMCLSSGFAGVYFEKVLKTSSQSLWGRNIQLAISSVLLGLVAVWFENGAIMSMAGFFQGYTWLTWFVIFQQAALGLVVSLVIKYADNIMKGFASAVSIVLSTFVSFLMSDLTVSYFFFLGASLVMAATLLYSHNKQQRDTKTQETIV